GLNDRGGREIDRVLVGLGWSFATQRRGHQGEERPVTDDRRGAAVHVVRDSLEANATSDRGAGQGLVARRDEVKVRPGSLLPGGVLRLRDSRFVRGPLFQARSL